MNELSTINVSSASLPATYEKARTALAECVSLDECNDWGDKAAALASYARQAKDDQLERMAQRIRARAIRRAGELLKQLDGRGGDRSKTEGGHGSAITQTEAARAVGMSAHQQLQAVRVASIPANVFDTCVDDERPATVTQLADMGKRAAPKPLIDLKGRDPRDFNRSMHFVGLIETYEREVSSYKLDTILPILDASEIAAVRRVVGKIDAIHDQIVTRTLS